MLSTLFNRILIGFAISFHSSAQSLESPKRKQRQILQSEASAWWESQESGTGRQVQVPFSPLRNAACGLADPILPSVRPVRRWVGLHARDDRDGRRIPHAPRGLLRCTHPASCSDDLQALPPRRSRRPVILCLAPHGRRWALQHGRLGADPESPGPRRRHRRRRLRLGRGLGGGRGRPDSGRLARPRCPWTERLRVGRRRRRRSRRRKGRRLGGRVRGGRLRRDHVAGRRARGAEPVAGRDVGQARALRVVSGVAVALPAVADDHLAVFAADEALVVVLWVALLVQRCLSNAASFV